MLSKLELRQLEIEVEGLKELRATALAAKNYEKASALDTLYNSKFRLLETERDLRTPDPAFRGKAF
jgi:hypothetical protein